MSRGNVMRSRGVKNWWKDVLVQMGERGLLKKEGMEIKKKVSRGR